MYFIRFQNSLSQMMLKFTHINLWVSWHAMSENWRNMWVGKIWREIRFALLSRNDLYLGPFSTVFDVSTFDSNNVMWNIKIAFQLINIIVGKTCLIILVLLAISILLHKRESYGNCPFGRQRSCIPAQIRSTIEFV